MNWFLDSICYLGRSGSQCYGTSRPESDLDIKGYCLPPIGVREHLFNKFEQALNNDKLEEKYNHLRNPLNPKIESSVYSLSKFFTLAAAVNPNIIEILYTDESDILEINKIGRKVRENREIFLSSRARHSFLGYANAQFYKIERHRKWIVKGEIPKPERAKYGLPEYTIAGFGECERFIKRELENWNFSKYNLEDVQRDNLKESVWELVARLSQNRVNWDNWPQEYLAIGYEKLVEKLNLNSDIARLISKELEYQSALKEYNSWLIWKEERNRERKALEDKCGYDSKHAMQLLRLDKMAVEILSGQGVIVKRPDAKELLEIRNGNWSFDKLMEEHKKLDAQAEALYKTTKLPKSVDYEKINNLYQEILSES